jgi:hypothetical protein
MYERVERPRTASRGAWAPGARGKSIIQPAGTTNRRSFARLDARVWTKLADDSSAQSRLWSSAQSSCEALSVAGTQEQHRRRSGDEGGSDGHGTPGPPPLRYPPVATNLCLCRYRLEQAAI